MGICLGHQAIGVTFGANLLNIPEVYHGVNSSSTLDREEQIYANLPEATLVGRYRSWVVDRQDLPSCKRFSFVRMNSKQVYWYALVNSRTSKQEGFNIKELFRDCHRDVQELIERIDISDSIKGEVMDIKPMNTWSREGACLLGDAAHATTPNMGQGACQAIEDAYVLAKCLQKYSASEALDKYLSLRMKKAHMVTNDSWAIGKISQLNNNLGIYFRNKLMRMTPNRIGEKRMIRLCALDYNL